MFDWITKPYIKWNFLDNTLACIETIIIFIFVVFIIELISNLKK